MFQPEDFPSLTDIHTRYTLQKMYTWIKLNFLWVSVGGLAWNPHVCVTPTHRHQANFYDNDNLPAYVLALFKRSVHACMSAKARIPKQLTG